MGFLRSFVARRGNLRAGDLIQRGVLSVAVVLLVSMITVAILLALAARDGGAGVTAFVLFVAAAAIGAALGFVFGLPRARVADGAASTAPTASTFYLTNSNLIKVSDWLTTIVIGLGLVNPAAPVSAAGPGSRPSP